MALVRDHKLHGPMDRYNYLRYLWELAYPRPVLKFPPPLVVVEPTTVCNLNCVYCAHETMKREKKHIDIKFYNEVLGKLRGKVRALYIHQSGEPLLHPQITELIGLARDAGFYTLVNTNTTILNEDTSRKILKSGLDVIEFSIDAIDEHAYESIRRNGRAREVWRNALRFLRLKSETASDIIVRVRIVECDANKRRHGKDAEILKKLPFDEIRVSKYLNNKYWEDAEKYYEGPVRNPIMCMMPWKEMTVSCDGSTRCAVDFDHAYKWGDIKKQSLMEAWNSDSLIRLRKAFLSGDIEKLKKVNDICWRCNAKTKLNYNDSAGFTENFRSFGRFFPAYYFKYLRFVRTPEEESEIREKYSRFDESVEIFEEYAGYKVTPL